MAPSDKESDRGNAGRDSNQSAEPTGETQSSEVAARPVRPAPTSTRGVRHERFLGIFVVIILMFALAFLVYQKVERHERLARVAIPAQANNPAAADQAVAAAATADFTQEQAADPLQAETPDATPSAVSQSPFADSLPAFSDAAEPPTKTPPAEPSLANTDPEFAPLSEPTPTADPDASPQNRSTQFGELALADDLATSVESTTPSEPGIAADSESAADKGSVPVQPFGSLDEPTMDSDSSSPAASDVAAPLAPVTDAAANPEFPSFDSLPAEQSPAGETAELTSPTLAEPTSPAASEIQPESSPESLATTDASLSEFSLPPSGASAAPGPGPANLTPVDPAAAEAESTLGTPQLDLSVPLAETDVQTASAQDPRAAAPAQPADDQPQLLALAEPQQQSPFGEFNPGAASQPPATERNDSAGFRAVTRPAVSQRSPTSPGATGADREGRFSLAAFNTQNAAVAAGKDDGEKHNSIIVQNGENYSKISKRVYGTTRYFSALAVFNQHRIPDPNAMRPGMIVLTPDPKLLEERYPQLFLDRQPKVAEPAGFFLLEDGSPAYRVGARETLSSISERFLGRSTRWGEIYQLNRSVLKDPNALKPGLVLALPEDATEVQLIP